MTDSRILENSAPLTEEALTFQKRRPTALAIKDLKEGLQKWQTWLMLAYQDIIIRYRRSVLGPFWITLSMALTVYSMGYLYGHLFHANLETYYPFLVAGMLSWTLISTTIIEVSDSFILLERMIKQIKLPYSLYIHRVVTRNFLIFFHNLLVIVPVYVIFYKTTKINSNMLFLIPGLLILYVNAFFYGLILAMVGARYRDISQIIKSLIQIVFFLTPVMWSPEILPVDKIFVVKFNPFNSLIEMIRAPLTGNLPASYDFYMILVVTLIGIFGCYKLFAPYRERIVYWL